MKEFAEREGSADDLLRELLTCQKKTLGQTRLAAAFTVLLAVLLIAALAALAVLVPRTLALEKQAKATLAQLGALVEPVDRVVGAADDLISKNKDTLQESLDQLDALDLDSLSETLRKLNGLDLDGLGETLKKLDGVDLDSLNNAIRKLNDAAKPLADLARRLGGG